MLQTEIAGHTYMHKTMAQLRLLLQRRQERLNELETYYTEHLQRAQTEKTTITQYLDAQARPSATEAISY